MVYPTSDFSEGLKSAESSGGVTGSVRVEREGKYFQFKFSILDLLPINLRRIKAEGSDRENFGEVFSGRVARSMLGNLAPEVSLVYGGLKKRIAIVSQYLDDVYKGTLDNYLESINGAFDRKHARIVLQTKGNFIPKEKQDKAALYLDENSPLAESLADALAISALLGDHDVNPGNMIVTKDPNSDNLRVGRIDFGHACNDLLNAPRALGGKLIDKENPVFDFFNRTRVAGARRRGDPSKLWRDYEGFLPSTVLADALLRLGTKHTELKRGLESARQEFFDLLDKIEANPDDNISRKHLIKSLDAIHRSVTGQSLAPDVMAHNQMVKCFKALDAFVQKNAKNALKAGRLMRLQAEFNQAIREELNKPLDKREPDSFYKIQQTWQDKFKAAGFVDSETGHVPWFRQSKNEAPFTGNVTEYFINQVLAENHKKMRLKPTARLYAQIKADMTKLIIFIQNYFKTSNKPSEKASELLDEAKALEEETGIKHDLCEYEKDTGNKVYLTDTGKPPPLSMKERASMQRESLSPHRQRKDIQQQ